MPAAVSGLLADPMWRMWVTFSGNDLPAPPCYTYFKKTIHSLTKIRAIFACAARGGHFCGGILRVCVIICMAGSYKNKPQGCAAEGCKRRVPKRKIVNLAV